jgi:hypothetical protein
VWSRSQKIQTERVQWVFGGPQASSCKDTNIAFGSRQALVHHTQSLTFTF